MARDFKPDIMIGVNVGDVALKRYPYKKDDDLLTGTLLFLGNSVADSSSVGKNGIYIQPDLGNLGAADFAAVRSAHCRG